MAKDKVSKKKASSKKVSKKKTATRKKAATKKVASKKAVKKTARKKATTKTLTVPDQKKAMLVIDPAKRQMMVAEAAYYHWEQSGFAVGLEMEHWFKAEQEIDEQLNN